MGKPGKEKRGGKRKLIQRKTPYPHGETLHKATVNIMRDRESLGTVSDEGDMKV